MSRSWIRTLRFVRGWLRRGPPVEADEMEIEGEAGPLPATRFRPEDGGDPSPSWILLHGVTRPGRGHPELVRFARAVAGSGATVLVPEIREWAELRLAPERTTPVVRACVRHLERDGNGGAAEAGLRGTSGRRSRDGAGTADAAGSTVPAAPGLIGFSFGAPQALRTAAHPSLQGRIGGVVGFGAYLDVERTFRFQLTGRHEWRGRVEHLDPDPYGRWIVGANYLAATPEHEDADDVARALRELAAEAGDRQIPADDPALAPLRRRMRETVDPERRPLFDLFAPAADRERDPDRVEALADAMADAAERVAPDLDVRRHLHGIRCPVELVHGREDRLIPYTETLRLAEALPSHVQRRVSITGLFSHSRENPIRAGLATLREGWRFLRTMRRVLGLV